MGKAALAATKRNYYFALSELNEEKEYGGVSAGIGSGIHNTQELKVLSFEEAMAGDDHHEWEKSVEHEHDQMTKNGVWEVVNQQDVPKNSDIIKSTWAMKKKANGEYQAHMAACGFKQTQGKFFIHHDILLPVVHDTAM